MSTPPRLPIVTQNGDMLAYMSAAKRRRALDTAFEIIGGVDRLADWGGKNLGDFYRIWAKGPLPVTQNNTTHDVNASSVESLWKKLDDRKKAKATGRLHDMAVIDVEPEPSNDAG